LSSICIASYSWMTRICDNGAQKYGLRGSTVEHLPPAFIAGAIWTEVAVLLSIAAGPTMLVCRNVACALVALRRKLTQSQEKADIAADAKATACLLIFWTGWDTMGEGRSV
ncbi:MAG: hypothetical protein NZ473_05060, partial [Candidatus Kapabacteria bacterium]|nr:hypothetical protein [Candidatus Kapabacteria bacterium]